MSKGTFSDVEAHIDFTGVKSSPQVQLLCKIQNIKTSVLGLSAHV